jgi:putative ubiquitin-RnfH superfamily antitoxin RatB of RatAB toxin-antitoxin module
MADQAGSQPVSIEVEVAYASPQRQRLIVLQVGAGTRVREVVKQSGLVAEFPEIDPERCPLGIFGERVADDYELANGDRVEIYRPLRVDPREARRERAASGKN